MKSLCARRAACLVSLSLAVLAGCSTPVHTDGSTGDATDILAEVAADSRDVPVEASGPCATDSDCSDHVYCNGVERCMPSAASADGRGCVAADPPNPCLPGQRCDDAMSRCVSTCSHAPDADGDGHRAQDCGGDDCDDGDANRFPGNPEVCDASNRDEDCDTRTFGFRDGDMDGFVDAQCCNADAMAHNTCGDDCNDSRANVHPSLAEACDGLDNNCNAIVDEDVQRTFHPDADGDGYGDMAGAAMMGCFPPPHFAEPVGDCDDARSDVHPGAIEVCDGAMVDENCDGAANPASLCQCAGDVSRMCATLRGVCTAGTERCVGGGWGACSIQPVAEVCNGVDDNCDGTVDEALSVSCYPDGDNDGYPAAGAVVVHSCPVPGRDAFAGCPPNQTNRAPIAVDIDCNDTDSTVSPGQPELCDAAARDENCDGTANPVALCSCLDGQTRPCSSTGSCGAGNQTCSGGHWSTCSINPVAESCNGIDDDCDGMTDELLTITCYADADNDGYAATGATAIQSCPVAGRDGVGGCPTNQTNRAPTGANVDCSATNAAISPAAVEQCDTAMVDEDCDGTANPSAVCACSGSAMRACTLLGSCAAGTQTCFGGSWGNCSIVPVSESCNALDDNCNGTVDEGLTVTCYADADNDGYAATGAAAVQSCPATGRTSFGGCPTGQTNRAPTGVSIDCNDAASTINPAMPEVCDGAMADENCDGTANPSTLCACSGTATRTCPLPGACAASMQTCSSGTWSACSTAPVTEACNGVDDNCNGTTDESLTVTCYADGDNDGFAAAGATTTPICPVPGRTAVGGCPTNLTNRAPTVGNTDCSDTNSSINPGATELCDAAMVDENCDGAANPPALCVCSGSGTRACTLPGACAAGNQTCTAGSWSPCSIAPTAETCNGIDDNCNGTVDDGVSITCFPDADNDGYAATGATSAVSCPVAGRGAVGGCPANQTNRAPGSGTTDCSDANPSVNPGAAEQCDAAMVDENCDGAANPASLCACSGSGTRACSQPGACAAGNQTCIAGSWGLCSIAPTAETCNGIDDNCNGTVDDGVSITCFPDGDNDGYPAMGATAAQTCPVAGRGAVGGCPANQTNRAPISGSVDCNDANLVVNPGAIEVCDAAMVDENCDGQANPATLCACSGSVMRGCAQPGACAAGTQTCVSGLWSLCSIQPTLETCNGTDDNCNGSVDEGLAIAYYPDADHDGYGAAGSTAVMSCVAPANTSINSLDCNDADPLIRPGVAETCDGVDNDCDGMTDEAGSESSCYAGAPNATFGCVAGACRVLSCTSPYRDCDTAPSNGCESNSQTDALNCGGAACGVVCGIAGECTAGTCDVVTQVAAGATWTCALRSSGNLACWGDNAAGQLGLGNTTSTLSPVPVPDIATGTSVAAADQYFTTGRHTCVTTSGGPVMCTGDNARGQLGNGTGVSSTRFTPAAGCGGAPCTGLQLGANHTCGLSLSTVYCWGGNESGQVGDGTSVDRFLPVSAGLGSDLGAGAQDSCRRTSSGGVTCSGSPSGYALGNNDSATVHTSPVPVCTASVTPGTCSTTLTSIVGVEAGTWFACAFTNTGAVYCWGTNGSGQAGVAGGLPVPVARLVAGVSGVTALALGDEHACALSAGAVWCWGNGTSGQLGNNATLSSSVPVRVLTPGSILPTVNLANVTQISASGDHTCAVATVGTVDTTYCWGRNLDGELGLGTTVNRPLAIRVPGL